MFSKERIKRQQTGSDVGTSMSASEGRRTSTYIVYSTSTLSETADTFGTLAPLTSSSTSLPSQNMSGAVIAGGVLGGVVFTLVFTMFLVIFFRSRKRKRTSRELPMQDDKRFMFPSRTSVFGALRSEEKTEKIKGSGRAGAHARNPSEVPLLAEPPAALMSYSNLPVSMMAPARPIRGSASLPSLCASRSERSIPAVLSSSASSDQLMQAHDPFGAYAPVSILPPRSVPRSSSRSTLGF